MVTQRTTGTLGMVQVRPHQIIKLSAGCARPDQSQHAECTQETAAIRAIADTSAVNWDKVVFATSLNPCAARRQAKKQATATRLS